MIKIPKATQLPSGSWRCQVCINGRRYSFVEDTEEEAVRVAMLKKLSGSRHPGDALKVYEQITVSEAIDHYISERSNVLSPSTIKAYRSMQRHRFQTVMNRKVSDNINWQAVVNEEAKTVTAKTLKNAWGLITSAYGSLGLSTGEIRLPQVMKNEHEFLQPDQIKTFVSAVHGHRFETAYLLGLHGLRRSEICAVRKESVKDGYIHVVGSKVYDEHGNLIERKENKTSASNRSVPVLIPRLSELIDQCDTEYLCPYNPSSLCHPLNTICRNNELPEIGLHGLRHSFASLCYHLGISEMQCMNLGGWSDINVMRKIYTHLANEDKIDAENKLRNFFI